jgi:hypothetical protein
VTDWPAYYGPSETPLQWAATSDDVEVAAALIDGGADVAALGGSIAGGGPLADAVGYAVADAAASARA